MLKADFNNLFNSDNFLNQLWIHQKFLLKKCIPNFSFTPKLHYSKKSFIKRLNYFLYFILFIFIFSSQSFAQWVNDPAKNTMLTSGTNKPINISTVDDYKGGVFIFWEDKIDGNKNQIYFLHIDENGNASFRSDGKNISNSNGKQIHPVCSVNLPNSAVLIWKDFSYSNKGELFAQKVFSNGNLAWNKNGIRISESGKLVNEYSAASDETGNVYIAYLFKDEDISINEKLNLEILNSSGEKTNFKETVLIADSPGKKSMPSVVPGNSGSVYLFWKENVNNSSIIFAQKIDSSGKKILGDSPLKISDDDQDVISYTTQLLSNGSVYIAYQSLNNRKQICHQVVSSDGKLKWNNNLKIAVEHKSNISNPQVLSADSTIILSWTAEGNNDKDIFIQKFNLIGTKIWKGKAVQVIDEKGDQFGQRLTSDGKNGVIVTWIDKRIDSVKANIFAQRINNRGEKNWNEKGIAIASHYDTEKSYTSVVSDLRGGAIVIFKEKRNGTPAIYGQKIFNTGTYISQVLGFTTSVLGDSVKVSWYSANETPDTYYEIERATQSDSTGSRWFVIDTMFSDIQSNAKYYEYFDIPDKNGTLYYRVIQKDKNGNIQPSDVTKINYFGKPQNIIVAQNIPNPFSDSTTISFYLPKAAIVNIEFYNSRVKVVRKIENQSFTAGKHNITFYPEDLESGIYFYRFECDDFIDVKKMVISN